MTCEGVTCQNDNLLSDQATDQDEYLFAATVVWINSKTIELKGVTSKGLTAITATATVDNTAVLAAVAEVNSTLNQIGKQDAY